MSEKRNILKITGLLGLLTLLSRITGLARDMVIAAQLGGSLISDVFFNAFELSNLARRILGEGALSAFVIPIFESERRKSRAEGWVFVNRAMNAVGLLAAILTLFGMIFSDFIFKLFGGYGMLARAASADPASQEAIYSALEHGNHLTRLMFPNLIGLAVGSVMMGVCNALGSFKAPAFGSVLLNLTMILAGVFALTLHADPRVGTVWLAWAVLGGAALRMLIMIPPMAREGWRWRPSLALADPAVRDLFRMIATGLLSMSIMHINMSVVNIFANFLGPGNKTYLIYAQRLIQFPMALTATAMATATLPQVTRLILDKQHDRLREVMGFLKRVELVLMMPAAVGLMFFGLPIVRMLFERGKFTETASEGTAVALLYYAPGLLAYGWVRLILPIYIARRDLRRQVKADLITMFCNVGLAAFFTFFTTLGHGGLALANTLSAFINYATLSWFLRNDPTRPLAGGGMTETMIKTFAAAVLATGAAWLGYHFSITGLERFMAEHFAGLNGMVLRAILLVPFLVLSAVGYFGLAHVFRVPDSDRAVGMIRGRLRRRSAPG